MRPNISNRGPILQERTLPEYIAPLLRADAKTYSDAPTFIERNSTFFTTQLSRPPYTPASTSSTDANDTTPAVPMQALHTAAAALTLVPPTHWTVETHRSNITSYDGSAIASSSEGQEEADSASSAAMNKLFKKELYHYLRWALSASAPGPGIPETMAILGRDESVRRLQDAKTLTASLVPPVGRRVPKSSSSEENGGGDRSWMGSLASR